MARNLCCCWRLAWLLTCAAVTCWALTTSALAAGDVSDTPVADARESADNAPPTISGLVLDERGQPVHGAKVWLTMHWFWLDEEGGESGPTETDADGKFSIEVPARWDMVPQDLRQELGIVAWAEEQGLGAIGLYGQSPLPTERLTIKLTPPVSATLQILSHDGQPLVDARVQPVKINCDVLHVGATLSRMAQLARMFGSEPQPTVNGLALRSLSVSLPRELKRRLQAASGADGKAIVSGVPLDQLAGVAVENPHIGRQVFQVEPTGLVQNRERLAKTQLNRPVRVTGQVIGPPGEVAGKRLRLLCAGTYDGPRQISSYATADLTLPADGRFSATLCEGQVFPRFAWDPQSPLRPVATQPMIKADDDKHIEIKVEPAVLVYGYVRDWETDAGVPQARVMLRGGWWDWQTAITDQSGRYEALVAAGPVIVDGVAAVDYAFDFAAQQRQQLENQMATGRQTELKPIGLRRTMHLVGKAVDDAGQPVAGATVDVSWVLSAQTVLTDERGRFEVRGITPGAEVRISAAKGTAFTPGVSIFKKSQSDLELRLSADHGIVLTGRLVDSGGRPVVKTKLQFWHRPWMPVWSRLNWQGGRRPQTEAVSADAAPEQQLMLTTDEEGRFRTPPLRPDGLYRVSLANERFEPAHSPWFDVADGKSPPQFDLLARKRGEHLGVVRDSAGKPVADALVEFQAAGRRIEAKTDATGQFRLEPAPDGPGLLFISKDNHRFHGQELNSIGESLAINLARLNEPYPASLPPAPAGMPRERRRQIARQLIDQFLAEINNDDTSRMRALCSLATFDPAAALTAIAEQPLADERRNDAVRYDAAKALVDTSPDDALQLAEAIGGQLTHMACMLYVRIAAALPADKREQKLQVLADALVRAGAIREPGFRLMSIAWIAEGLLDIGETQRGTKLLLDNLPTAQELNRSGFDAYLRGAFAQELAQVDLAAALALVNEITDYSEQTRHLANIAHEIAAAQPAEAENIFAEYPPPPEGSNLINQKDRYVVRACYRMAQADLPRAIRLADTIVCPFTRAHAHGVMAVGVSKTDVPKAGELVRTAFDIIDAGAKRKPEELPLSKGNVGTIGGWLVAHAQRFDPQLAAEARWRLLRVLPDQPWADPGQQRSNDIHAIASAAMFLAEVDPELARSLLERLDGDPQLAALGGNFNTWLPAWALVDPEAAVKRLDKMLHASSRSRSTGTVAEAIALEGIALERVLHDSAGIWRIDVEDIDN
jgi:protocatechuate 3,4-dioxygenase beta subunit